MSGRSAFPSNVARRLCVIASLLLWAAPAAAQSLWTERAGSLLTDLRARRAGDILTVLIDEQSTAEKNAQTDLKRDSSFSSQLTPPNFDLPSSLKKFLLRLNTSGTGKSDYEGDAKTNRTDRATGIITVKVLRVLENGNLAIEGRRLVKVNEETQTLVVSGLVRPYDVTPDNTVASSRIADGEVRLEGTGAVSDRQKPGFIQRIFDFLGLY